MPFDFSVYPFFFLAIAVIGISMLLKHRAKPQHKRPHTGFLSNYDKLSPKNSHSFFYFNQTDHWPQKIYFEPITVLTSKNSQTIPKKYIKMLASYFEYAMREAVEKNIIILEQPTPDCIHVRTAIADLESANPVKNFFSRRFMLVPIDFGTAAIEGELINTQTGEQLAAIIDHQVGSVFSSPFHHAEWGDVMQAFDSWAKQLNKLLAKTPAYSSATHAPFKAITSKLRST
ncbi:MAG: DUF3313 domain-containing protein, partial [Methylococcales bacterium]|nr:DUF3313 domain-containing protein [Methylococcales bacterium]